MPILEIDGLGRVEVDDTFLKMSPQEQEATINEIVQSTQASPQGHITPTPQAANRQPLAQPQPKDPEIYAPDGFGGNAYNPETGGFNDDWVKQQEADYQASLKHPQPTPLPQSPTAAPPTPEQTSRLGAFGLGALDGLSFGLDDEIGGGLAAVIPGIGKSSIWDGKSLSDAANENIDAYRGVKKAAEDEHFGYFLGGGLAGGLLPITGGLGGAKALGTLGKLGAAAKTGAAYGAAYGFGSDEGGITDRLDGAATGAALGAIGGTALHGATKATGAILSPAARRLFPKLADAQFAKAQAGNPHALTDAKVSDDLDKIVRTLSVGNAKQKLSKAQESTLLSRIDDLETSYLPVDELKSLDLPPSTKARLQTAMAKRHLLSDSEVQSLRDGTPAGDAVAEAVEKSRRLRAYVPEGRNASGSRIAADIGGTIGSTAGWKVGGPIGGAIGGNLGRAMSRSRSRQVAEALSLAGKASRFANLPEVIAARESANGSDSLSRLSADALDAPYLAKKAAQAEADRLNAEGRKVGIANARDNVKPSGGYRGSIYDRTGLLPAEQDAGALKALNDGAITSDQFKAHLDDPSKLMAGNAGNALIDRLGSMADNGVLKRDPKWTPPSQAASREAAPASYGEGLAKLSAREAELIAELDRLDPVTMSGGEGQNAWNARVSEVYPEQAATDPDLIKAGEVRQQLAELRARQASAETIRNPLAYAATARGNQQRVSETLRTVMDHPALPSDAKEALATAVASIGNTSSRAKAQGIATDALDRLGADHRDYGRSVLTPLIEQIKR
ncbi:hypothetical protein [Sphingomonas sp. IC081]|uniref:hypothetical protein n=1 Tax=Sphingomonas sp. IC081 TaxID=304378 RepID=UPI0011585843|nr:hypothetical protein [Sphingomonas sp. IC081]QDK34721.1 hypothetical protein DM450_18445 [Sphingomonas sp. IC081]